MKKLTPTSVTAPAEVLVDLQFIADLVQQVDRLAGDIRRLEAAQASHVEAHGLSAPTPVSLGSLAAEKPATAIVARPAADPEPEQDNPTANALLVKIASREGCTVESVRAMLSGKREHNPDGSPRSEPRGKQFGKLRAACSEQGIPLVGNVEVLRQLARPYLTFPTLYGAIKAGRQVRIT